MAMIMRVCKQAVNIDGNPQLQRVFRRLATLFRPFSRHIYSSRSRISSGPDRDMIYRVLTNEDGNVPVARFIGALREAGLRVKDPRLKETMTNFQQYLQQENFEGFVDEGTFRRYYSATTV